MRRFLITGSSFTGEAELLYTDEGLIACVDLRHTNMNPAQRNKFLSLTPVHLSKIEDGEAYDKKLVITEHAFVVTFEMFWEKYDMKRNKAPSKILFEKLPKSKQVQAYVRIAAYDKYRSKNPWLNKMYPDTWLRGQHWEDEWEKL